MTLVSQIGREIFLQRLFILIKYVHKCNLSDCNKLHESESALLTLGLLVHCFTQMTESLCELMLLHVLSVSQTSC